jgi:hypothetical protein
MTKRQLGLLLARQRRPCEAIGLDVVAVQSACISTFFLGMGLF